ncbi:MAG: aminotransferase class V-fold PLP-dependent enzyme [Sandaracinaceae bacterium]|nr:aminotransferase class V-fold PLP-dependent enzyme [Sandaracinaceae bacterium]
MTQVDEQPLLKTREEFPTLENSVHLISHSLGAMPRKAREHTKSFLDLWEQDSIEAWSNQWLPHMKTLGNLVAKVLGVDAGTVIMNQNVSTVQAIVASCFDWTQKRNKIVYSELEFSTVHYVWQAQARRGARVNILKSDDGMTVPLERLFNAIDEETLIVPLSHVLFRSSTLQDLKAIIKRAHEVGAYVLADCYQSAATIPLALKEWNVDFACGGSVKWACGGPGAAYLYVRPDLLPLMKPIDTGWFGHAEPFAFDMGEMRYANDMWRMVGGTPAIPALYSALAGWEIVAGLSQTAVRAKSLRQTTMLRSLAEKRGFQINTPHEDAQRGGTICFDFGGSDEVAKELNKRRFFCDWRPGCGIRASPHFYTTDEEISRFIDEVDRIR